MAQPSPPNDTRAEEAGGGREEEDASESAAGSAEIDADADADADDGSGGCSCQGESSQDGSSQDGSSLGSDTVSPFAAVAGEARVMAGRFFSERTRGVPFGETEGADADAAAVGEDGGSDGGEGKDGFNNDGDDGDEDREDDGDGDGSGGRTLEVQPPSGEAADAAADWASRAAAVVNAAVERAAASTDQGVSHIFGSAIGAVVAQYACKYQGKRGALHLATRAACFHATGFLGLELERVIIPLGAVAEVLELSGGGISVRDQKGGAYEFTGLGYRREVCLHVFLNLRERLSAGMASDGEETSGGGEEEEEEEEGGQRAHPPPPNPIQLISPLSLTPPESSESSEGGGDGDASEYVRVKAGRVDARSKECLVREICSGNITKDGWETAKTLGLCDSPIAPEALRDSWLKFRDAKEPSFDTVIIDRQALPCTITEYFDTFVSDGAHHPIAAYQRKIGDSEVETTPWRLSGDSVLALVREVTYIHPINAPMAPPTAAACKEQTLRRWGDHALCVTTRTIVKDVPVVDCFFVEDQLLLESTPEDGVRITGRFEIRFIKRTMLRSFIHSTTTGEFRKWFEGYQIMVEKVVKDQDHDVGEGEKLKIEVEPEPFVPGLVEERKSAVCTVSTGSKAERYLLVLVVLVAILVVLQTKLMLQIQSTNRMYLELSSRQEQALGAVLEMLEECAVSKTASSMALNVTTSTC